MSKVYIFRGVPASGKSTEAIRRAEADPKNVVRVNRDDIRMLMFGEYHFSDESANDKENAVTQTENALIKSAIVAGKDVIVDSTNLNKQTVKRILRIAGTYFAEVEFVDFEVSYQDAVGWDWLRGKRVGEKVINRFFQKHKIDEVTGKLPEPPTVPSLMDVEFQPYVEPSDDAYRGDCVLVDIDGTIAHMTGRSPYDYSRVSEDSVDEHLSVLIRDLHRADYKIIFFTGRKSDSHDDTLAWLEAEFGDFEFDLYMRPADDERPDYVVKYEMFHKYIQGKYRVHLVLDDRLQVCRMWHKLGVKVLRVGDPDADF